MATAGAWVILIFSIVFVVVSAHLIISQILPRLKALLLKYMDERNSGIVMYIFLFYIGVLVLNKVVELLISAGDENLNYLNILNPGLNLFVLIAPYVAGLVLVSLIVSGLKRR